MRSSMPTGRQGPSPAIAAQLIAFLERTNDLVGVTDHAGRVTYVNDATRTRLGLAEEHMRCLTTADIFPASAFKIFFKVIRPAIASAGEWSGYLPMQNVRGEIFDLWVTIVGEAQPGGKIVWLVMSGRDITAFREAHNDLTWRASHDELTGLARRLVLNDRLEQALARSRRMGNMVAVAFIDVDDLKAVNDAFGHDGGDELLCEVARRLSSTVRAVDTVARLGGDEFVVVCDGVEDEQEAAVLCSRLRDAVTATPVRINRTDIAVSASVGFAVSRGDCGGRDLLKQADLAMYEAKRHPPAGDN